MKRILTYLGAVAAAAICFSACQKEQENPVKGASHTITFTAESAKTVIDGTGVVWTEADKDNFYIFEDGIKATSVVVTIVDHKATAVATFAGEGTGSHQYNAYVTGSVDAEDSPVISTKQTATATSFDSNADILIAKPITGENTAFTFEFKRFVSIAKMHIKGITAGETVDFVKISNHGETGALTGTYDPATGAFTPTTGEDKIVVNTAGTDPVFFMVAENEEITPTVQVWTNKGVYTKTFDKAIDFPMGKIREFSVQYSAEQRVDRPKDYTLVTSVDELKVGGLIVFGCSSKNAVAGPIASGNKFMNSENATITEEGVLTPGINSDVEEITLGKNGENWVFNTKNGVIGTSAVKSLAYNSGTQVWGIEISKDGEATITTSAYTGSLRYNSSSPRFLTYASGQTAIQIYKYDDGKTPLAQPEVTLTPDAAAKKVSVSWNAVPNATSYVVSCTGKDDIPTTGTTAQFTELEYEVEYTVTVKAVGNDSYRDSQTSETFTIKDPTEILDSMDKIYEKAQKIGTTASSVTVKFCNWVVSGTTTSNAYVTDGTKGLIIYASSHGFEKGDVLSGTVTCNLQLFKNASEITEVTSTTSGLTVTKGGTVTPYETTIDKLSGVNTGAVVSLQKLICTGSTSGGYNLSDGTNTIVAYKTFITVPTLTTGTKYNVTGVYIQFNTTKEIAPRTTDDIVEVPSAKYAITIDPNIKNGTVTTSVSEAAEGVEVTLTAKPASGYKLKQWNVKKTASSEAITVTNNTFTMPAEAVTVSAEFEAGSTDYSTVYTSNVTFATGTNSYAEKVKISGTSYDALRLAKSSGAGSGTFKVPAGTTKIHVHVVGWSNNSSTPPTFSASAGTLTYSISPFYSDSGVSNSSPYTLAGTASDYYYVMTLSGATAETTITASAASGKRAVIFGVNAE